MLALSFAGLKAQVYYYVKAGDDPNSSSAQCIVIRWEDSGRNILKIETSVGQIKSSLLNDINYFENIKISKKEGVYDGMSFRYYDFKNSQSNMNIYLCSILVSKGYYSPPITQNGRAFTLPDIYNHYYLALSYDKKSLIDNPDRDEVFTGLGPTKKYYKQVSKSTFEFQGMNF